MSETHTYIPDEGLIAHMFLKEREEIGGLAIEPYTVSPALRVYEGVQISGQIAGTGVAVFVSHARNSMPANTLNESVWIAQSMGIGKTITLSDEKSVAVKLPPHDSDTIRGLFVSLDEDEEYGDESDSASEELIRLIESLGKPALEFLGKLIEDSVSYTNAFLGLELLGFSEQKSTHSDRIDIAIRMLSNRRAPVRHAAISVLATLHAEKALESLESLVLSDSSTLNRKLAQRAIEKIRANRQR